MSKDQHPFGHGVPIGDSEPGEGLGSILRGQSAQPARDGFRTSLKARFLAGDVAGESTEVENGGLAGELHESFGELLRGWKAPKPDLEFRQAMRGEFLEAEVSVLERAQEQAKAPAVEPTPEPKSAQAPEPVRRPEPARQVKARGSAPKQPPKSGTLLSFWTPLAVAAALVLFYFGPKFLGKGNVKKQPYEPELVAWSLPDDLAELEWTIDGETVDANADVAEIAKLLGQAESVAAVDGGGLRLAYGRYFQVEVAEGSALDLTNLNQVASNTDFHLGMVGDSGGFYFQTGPDFKAQDCELTFQTPEAEIAVVGTVFAVDRYTKEQGMEGTCVCCSQGTVRVVDAAKSEMTAPAGKSCFVMPGKSKMMPMDVVPDHQHPMDELIKASVPAGW